METTKQFVQVSQAGMAEMLPDESTLIDTQPGCNTSGAWRDWLGVTASILCAIHCAAMPFVIGFLPLLGLEFFANPAFHQWMVAVCLLLAVLAFLPGWRRHGRWTPSIVAVAGLTLIAVAAFAGAPHCQDADGVSIETNATATVTGKQSSSSNDAKQAVSCQTGCAACNLSLRQSESANVANATVLNKLWPWITPFGGVLLIVAHLLNRQLTWRCCKLCA